jgi:hypothetical protein
VVLLAALTAPRVCQAGLQAVAPGWWGITIDLKNRRLGLPGSKPLESSYRCSAYLQSGLAGRLRSRLELARLEG